jgi:hypothetical protein
MIQESGERWADQFTAASPDMAEDLARSHLEQLGGHLWVTGVAEGNVDWVDRHKWIDPSVGTQDEMDKEFADHGWVKTEYVTAEPDEDDEDRKLNPIAVAVLISSALLLILIGFLFGAVFT